MIPEPTIVDRDQIVLVGFSFFGDPFQMSGEWTEENEIGRLWTRFMAFLQDDCTRIKHVKNEQVMYEVHIQSAETALKGHFEIFAGLEVAKLEDVPVEAVVKILPPARYAVFALKGEQIVSDWPRTISDEWIPTSGYQMDYTYAFQLYDYRFKGLQNLDESEVDVYIPVK